MASSLLAQKAYRCAVNLAVGALGDFRKLAERSLPSLLHPDAPQDVREEMVEMSVRVGPETYVRQNRAVTARKDLRPVLAGIAVPTAVIVGEEDRLTPLAMSQEIHALKPGSILHVIPACGHMPCLDAARPYRAPRKSPSCSPEPLRSCVHMAT